MTPDLIHDWILQTVLPILFATAAVWTFIIVYGWRTYEHIFDPKERITVDFILNSIIFVVGICGLLTILVQFILY